MRRITLVLLVLSALMLAGCPVFTRDGGDEAAPVEAEPAPEEPAPEGGH